ncbi:zinc finger BED domain-containing protein 4-like [Leuresthes tenuis]|uniref:zinc finger BED domain-containing protein 4-like n=1 Tax=Leuresthes tenuis TaxID=355514 RepID=UPI003B50E2FB
MYRMADAGTENSENSENELTQQSESNKRKRQKMSKVWDHFRIKIKDNNTVVCEHCKMELAFHNSTTSMLQHLKRKHPFDDTSGRPETSKPSQPLMDEFVQKAPACSPARAAELTDSILNMLVTDMRPLSMVEDGGFKAMIATFHPDYELPSRAVFTELLHKKYDDVKAEMKKLEVYIGNYD